MGKIYLFLIICVFSIPLYADKHQHPTQEPLNFNFLPDKKLAKNLNLDLRDPPPEISFIPNGNGETVVQLMFSLDDLRPLGYRGSSMGFQPGVSMPYGYTAGGAFICYNRSNQIGTKEKKCARSHVIINRKKLKSRSNEFDFSFMELPKIEIRYFMSKIN